MSKPAPPAVPTQLTVRGHAPDRACEYAVTKVEQVLTHTHTHALHTHVVIGVDRNPARERPAHIEVTVDMDGTPVRAMVAAHDVWEAADLVEDRLRHRLLHLRDRARTLRRRPGAAGEHEWRHGALPRRPVPHYPRPAAEREIVRRKTFALEPVTLDEAAEHMELLDHDFYLFTDHSAGADAMIHHRGDGRLGLHAPSATQKAYLGEEQIVLETAPPTLTEAEARQRLDVAGEPFVFFLDPDTGRGRVLYWRYDGHYGLISAA